MRRLSAVDRFSSIPVVVKENVAEHSFWVVLYSMMIHSEVSGPSEAIRDVLAFAAVHDLPECLTGDVVRTFKYSSIAMRAAVDAAEAKLVERLPKAILALYEAASAAAADLAQSPNGWYVNDVVKAADFLSLYQYMWRERMKGNREIDQFFLRMRRDVMTMRDTLFNRSAGAVGEKKRVLAELALLYGCMADDKFEQEFTTT